MNKRSIRFVAISVLAGVAPLAAHAANLVTNGDFDNTAGTYRSSTPQGGDDQLSGGTPVPGWTSITGPADYIWVGPGNAYGLTASAGNGSGYFIDLTGQGDGHPYGSVAQTIATTAGATYTLTFDLGTSTTYDGSGASAAGVVVTVQGTTTQTAKFSAAPVTSDDWFGETFTFTADGASTVLAFSGDNAFSSEYVGLDNVSLTGGVSAVPEPAGLALMLAGLGLVGAAARRRHSSK